MSLKVYFLAAKEHPKFPPHFFAQIAEAAYRKSVQKFIEIEMPWAELIDIKRVPIKIKLADEHEKKLEEFKSSVDSHIEEFKKNKHLEKVSSWSASSFPIGEKASEIHVRNIIISFYKVFS